MPRRKKDQINDQFPETTPEQAPEPQPVPIEQPQPEQPDEAAAAIEQKITGVVKPEPIEEGEDDSLPAAETNVEESEEGAA